MVKVIRGDNSDYEIYRTSLGIWNKRENTEVMDSNNKTFDQEDDKNRIIKEVRKKV